MRLYPDSRRACLNAREFAEFRVGPAATGAGSGMQGLWRAEIGRQWHETLGHEHRSATGSPGETEVSLEGTLSGDGWTLELTGRADQIRRSSEGTTIGEVKTVFRDLPAPEDDLLDAYPAFVAQLSVYAHLCGLDPSRFPAPIHCQLLLIDARSGLRQSLKVPTQALLAARRRQWESVIAFLEDRWQSMAQRRSLDTRTAFAQWREGQESALEELRHAQNRGAHLHFEAPTGFGKTGLALHIALEALRENRFDRLIYLTGKTTGQTGVVSQIAAMDPDGHLRRFVMRNRDAHCRACPHAGCADAGRCQNPHVDAPPTPPLEELIRLLETGAPEMGAIAQAAEAWGYCPYAISTGLLPLVDCWVGDYHYAFSPSGHSLLIRGPHFDPSRCLLIVDEAHNLPERVAEAHSFHFAAEAAFDLAECLDRASGCRDVTRACRNLAEALDRQGASPRLPPAEEYEWISLLDDAGSRLLAAPVPWDELPEAPTALAGEIIAARSHLDAGTLPYLYWAPAPGQLRTDCLDASAAIAPVLRSFGGSLLMSATLQPFDLFRECTGQQPGEVVPVLGHAPWREGAYDVAIDARVDTRFRRREAHFETTARTVLAHIRHAPGQPVAVFFPSYRYAEAVLAYAQAVDPLARLSLQPRQGDLSDHLDWLDHALRQEDALFLVLGGRFAEGIDQLGGHVPHGIVVGPALPEVNARQEARLEACGGTRDDAFRRVFAVPGIRKIHQALGRLVRAPGQSARILLHDKRFTQPPYCELLDPDYAPARVIRNTSDLEEWLSHGTRRPS